MKRCVCVIGVVFALCTNGMSQQGHMRMGRLDPSQLPVVMVVNQNSPEVEKERRDLIRILECLIETATKPLDAYLQRDRQKSLSVKISSNSHLVKHFDENRSDDVNRNDSRGDNTHFNDIDSDVIWQDAIFVLLHSGSRASFYWSKPDLPSVEGLAGKCSSSNLLMQIDAENYSDRGKFLRILFSCNSEKGPIYHLRTAYYSFQKAGPIFDRKSKRVDDRRSEEIKNVRGNSNLHFDFLSNLMQEESAPQLFRCLREHLCPDSVVDAKGNLLSQSSSMSQREAEARGTERDLKQCIKQISELMENNERLIFDSNRKGSILREKEDEIQKLNKRVQELEAQLGQKSEA